jgi:hypothetical protein
MSYLDRLRVCTYTSPSGVRFQPSFDNVSRSGDKKAPVTELPQTDVPNVQDLGQGAIRFSMRLYFTGADYDTTSDNFFNALGEKGLAQLSHPRWGDLSVIPLSRAQAEDFVEGIRTAIFTVEFIKADDSINYPISARGERASIGNTAQTMELTVSANFARDFTVVDSRDRATLYDSIRTGISQVEDDLSPIASITAEVGQAFDQIQRDILGSIDFLLGEPATLAGDIIRLIRTPATIVTSIRDKVRGYLTVYQNLSRLLVEGIQWESEAEFVALILTAVGIGASECVIVGETDIGRAKTIQNTVDLATIRDGIEADISAMEAVAPGFYHDEETAHDLRRALTQAIALQVESGFSLSIERVEILTRDITPLDYVYSVYGSIERLDEWVQQNELIGDEHFIIRAGREVRYYE